MRKSDVNIGATYVVRWHDGSFTEVRIDAEIPAAYAWRAGSAGRSHYRATNLRTGRSVIIKSAAKLRREA